MVAPLDWSRRKWLSPWEPLQAARARERERRLTRHVKAGHPLHASVRALATRDDDAQTTLFVLDESDMLYLVPMGQLGKTAEGVVFSTFDSFEAFSEACMEPDHAKHTAAAPGR
jgi:hypothetical protein